jgi:hypothetical protein
MRKKDRVQNELIIGRRVVSKPGAAIKVTELVLSPEAERALSVSARSWNEIFPRRKPSLLKRLAAWVLRVLRRRKETDQ